MPRRSRRSPRHLRVSGQRRRRYRDERYPTQSPMPLTVACASPEMASGKVWIRYPVVRPQDQQQEEAQVQEFATTAVDPVITPAAAVEPAVSEVVAPEVVEERVVEPVVISEPVAVMNEPEAPVVETTHPEAIAAPVDEQPQLIAGLMKPSPKRLSQKPSTSWQMKLSSRKQRSLNLLRLKKPWPLLKKRLSFANRWLNRHRRQSR